MQKPRLLDPVREKCRVRHYSPRTEKTYIQWIKRYLSWQDKQYPKDLVVIVENGTRDVVRGTRKTMASSGVKNERLGNLSTLKRKISCFYYQRSSDLISVPLCLFICIAYKSIIV